MLRRTEARPVIAGGLFQVAKLPSVSVVGVQACMIAAQVVFGVEGGSLPPSVAGRGYLARIRAGSQRMGQLIDGLLQLGRIARANLDLQPVNLSDIAQGILRELRESEPQRRIHVSLGDGLTARADPVLLRIVLDNLLRNAWKFTSQCEQTQIALGKLRRDHETVYFVRDNGAGFDMAYAGKLFQPFSRLHTAERFSGTGIGLAAIARIIHRHGGRIWAESEPDRGATFYFTLPGSPFEPNANS